MANMSIRLKFIVFTFCHFLETSQVLWWKKIHYTLMLKNTLLALCLHDDQQERFLKELWFIFMPKLDLVIMLDVVNESSCVLLFFFLFLIPGSVKISSTVLILSTRFGSVFFNVFIQKLRCLSLLTWHVYLSTDRKCRTVFKKWPWQSVTCGVIISLFVLFLPKNNALLHCFHLCFVECQYLIFRWVLCMSCVASMLKSLSLSLTDYWFSQISTIPVRQTRLLLAVHWVCSVCKL